MLILNTLAYIFAIIGSYGISSGAHRLFAHKTYKANMKMKIMMVILQTIAFQNSVLEWVRDHRYLMSSLSFETCFFKTTFNYLSAFIINIQTQMLTHIMQAEASSSHILDG